MRKAPNRNIIFIFGGLFLALVLLGISVSTRSTPIDVSVTFTGFSNLRNSTNPPVTAASFCISNCGTAPVLQWPLSSAFEFKSQNSDILLGHFSANSLWLGGKPMILKPGETVKVYITTPAHNSRPWRIWYGFGRADWRLKLDGLPPRAYGIVTRFIPRKWLVIRPELEVAPDWITGPGSDESQSGPSQPRQDFPHPVQP